MEKNVSKRKALRAKLAANYKKVCEEQLCNKPSLNDIRKYRKQLKKHVKDPAKYTAPKMLRGWYYEKPIYNQKAL